MITIANEKFWKDVRKLNNRQVMQDIVDAIENVQNAANSQDIRELKRLKGAKAYRIRIGDYRIGITINSDNVEFITVGHRKNFYNFFP